MIRKNNFCFLIFLYVQLFSLSSQNLLPFSSHGKIGYIDENGVVIIQPQFLKGNKFNENRIRK